MGNKMKLTPEELNEKLKLHAKYLKQDGGERLNLRDANLRDADLSGANLRDADLGGADLFDADLSHADLIGADLIGADLSNANLSHANLRCADLRCADLRHADFRDAYLTGADLRDADLRHANLRDANFTDANFRDANLTGANLSNADLPQGAKIEKLFTKIQSAIKFGGCLDMDSWHGCETTHCIAGWVTHLAGETGRVMENLLSTPWAATLIILESCPYLEGKVPNFHLSNEDGMDFINECVDKEKG